ncbi:hypothetical protein M514_03955 [Trichuris suis]|uniref:Uncharacterized protein n=1 Tax=Trichuris suis TaxID=68888 RepID=A0A085MDL8_9BILA|nr:hypothetical protein M513_03955 [Trichuris suis]KFD65893.1 hypothetical protein M514_03955 [Trichuris suis]
MYRLRSTPMPRLYRLLLVFFVTFLLVGICLTCYGFFYYESELSFTKAARLVGIMTFLVSLGLLIAVFGYQLCSAMLFSVSLSSCMSRSVKSGGTKPEYFLEVSKQPAAHTAIGSVVQWWMDGVSFFNSFKESAFFAFCPSMPFDQKRSLDCELAYQFENVASCYGTAELHLAHTNCEEHEKVVQFGDSKLLSFAVLYRTDRKDVEVDKKG